jgi:hypothetical protein
VHVVPPLNARLNLRGDQQPDRDGEQVDEELF